MREFAFVDRDGTGIASARRYRKADHHDPFRFARWRPESSQK
jgi:hypothetical protein